jgi:hypothetical protein
MPIAKPQNITTDNDIMYPAAICKHNLSFFLSFFFEHNLAGALPFHSVRSKQGFYLHRSFRSENKDQKEEQSLRGKNTTAQH